MKKAMLFAAGLGTRLKPLTDHCPKALVEIDGQPLLALTLERLIAEGFEQVVVNVHHFASMIKEYLASHSFDIDIQISDESDELLDTGGGLRKALSLFHEDSDPILIHNVDILSNAPLSAFYESCRGEMAGLMVSRRQSTRHLLFDDQLRLCGWQNMTNGQVKSPFAELHPETQQHFAFSGIHCVDPLIAQYMQGRPSRFPIVDFYLSICDKVQIQAHPQENLRLLDVGKLDSLDKARAFLREG